MPEACEVKCLDVCNEGYTMSKGISVALVMVALFYVLGSYAPRQNELVSFGVICWSAFIFSTAAILLIWWWVEKLLKINWCRHCR